MTELRRAVSLSCDKIGTNAVFLSYSYHTYDESGPHNSCTISEMKSNGRPEIWLGEVGGISVISHI